MDFQECCCSLCGKPIGVPDEDPRWAKHDEYCDDCDLCRDQVPIILFRGQGEATEQAQFHVRCFEQALETANAKPQEPGRATPEANKETVH
jgi:hypothetical protein